MRLLVTGGAGFIGTNFVKQVLETAPNAISAVTVLDKLTYAGVESNLDNFKTYANFNFVQGDICDVELVNQLVDSVDAVINFAAESHVDRSIANSGDFVSTNVSGVQVLLDAIRLVGKGQRFLQVSTDEVYGSIDEGSWDEFSPLLPNSPYSATKAGGELIARAYHQTHNIDVVVTRCSNNFGPYQFPEKVIPLFITNLILGKKIPIYGDGGNVRDWLHVDDHCRGLYKVLLNGNSGEVYNIGGGQELSNLQLTYQILELMNASDSNLEFVEDRKGHDRRYSVDWSKIEKDLGYQPKINFQDGLKATINWYLQNDAWWKALKDTPRTQQ